MKPPFAIALCFACLSFPLPAMAAGKADQFPVVDVHTHTNFGEKPAPIFGGAYALEDYLKQRKEAGIVASVSMEMWKDDRSPDLRSRHVIHCAGVGERVDLERIEKGLESGRYGCVKIYLGYIPRYASDPAYGPVYRLAARYNVPVVFHTGDTSEKDALVKYADPMAIDEVAVANRDVRFVIAHLGNPWIETATEIVYKNPNVYVEASALLVGNLSTLDPKNVEEYVVKPIRWSFGWIEDPSKMLFGTDWPLNDMKSYLEAYKRAIPRKHWKAVFCSNAVAVYRLPADWVTCR
ncbi:MAG: amidohydrolase family protein [Elusimicrobia bacterium]|nr:amidohydrolase family protein [Elusimicrobiota bacterium]